MKKRWKIKTKLSPKARGEVAVLSSKILTLASVSGGAKKAAIDLHNGFDGVEIAKMLLYVTAGYTDARNSAIVANEKLMKSYRSSIVMCLVLIVLQIITIVAR